MVRRHQDKLQALSSLLSLGSFLALQKVLHEGRLIGGEALTAAEETQERVAVFNEDGREHRSRVGDRQLTRMCAIRTSRAVDE